MNPFRKKGEVEMYPHEETAEEKEARLKKEARMANAYASVKIALTLCATVWATTLSWNWVSLPINVGMTLTICIIFAMQMIYYSHKLDW